MNLTPADPSKAILLQDEDGRLYVARPVREESQPAEVGIRYPHDTLSTRKQCSALGNPQTGFSVMLSCRLLEGHLGAHQRDSWIWNEDLTAPPEPSAHYLTEDHNTDPCCGCGWTPNGTEDREEARRRIRQHVAEQAR